MKDYKLQRELFTPEIISENSINLDQKSSPNLKIIKDWHEKISIYQSNLFKGYGLDYSQGDLFNNKSGNLCNEFNPLDLSPLPLSFWRWPKSPHTGPAIYLVISKTNLKNKHLLLYVGETIVADKRWKGNHDCKTYLANYSETLQKVGFKHQLSIRFWLDVPKDTKSRQSLEQKLIQTWLPPFNKETRSRWTTPFTNQTE